VTRRPGRRMLAALDAKGFAEAAAPGAAVTRRGARAARSTRGPEGHGHCRTLLRGRVRGGGSGTGRRAPSTPFAQDPAARQENPRAARLPAPRCSTPGPERHPPAGAFPRPIGGRTNPRAVAKPPCRKGGRGVRALTAGPHRPATCFRAAQRGRGPQRGRWTEPGDQPGARGERAAWSCRPRPTTWRCSAAARRPDPPSTTPAAERLAGRPRRPAAPATQLLTAALPGRGRGRGRHRRQRPALAWPGTAGPSNWRPRHRRPQALAAQATGGPKQLAAPGTGGPRPRLRPAPGRGGPPGGTPGRPPTRRIRIGPCRFAGRPGATPYDLGSLPPAHLRSFGGLGSGQDGPASAGVIEECAPALASPRSCLTPNNDLDQARRTPWPAAPDPWLAGDGRPSGPGATWKGNRRRRLDPRGRGGRPAPLTFQPAARLRRGPSTRSTSSNARRGRRGRGPSPPGSAPSGRGPKGRPGERAVADRGDAVLSRPRRRPMTSARSSDLLANLPEHVSQQTRARRSSPPSLADPAARPSRADRTPLVRRRGARRADPGPAC